MKINRSYIAKKALPFVLLLLTFMFAACSDASAKTADTKTTTDTSVPQYKNPQALDWSETVPDDVVREADKAPTSSPTPLNQIYLDDGSTVQSNLDKYGAQSQFKQNLSNGQNNGAKQ